MHTNVCLQPKLDKPRTAPTYMAKRAVVLDPGEKKVCAFPVLVRWASTTCSDSSVPSPLETNKKTKQIYTLMQQIHTLRNEKDRVRSEKEKAKSAIRQRKLAAEEVRNNPFQK